MNHLKEGAEILARIKKQNEGPIDRALNDAISNAHLMGVGFMIVRRSSHAGDFLFQAGLWPEVDDALRVLGTRGPVGGHE